MIMYVILHGLQISQVTSLWCDVQRSAIKRKYRQINIRLSHSMSFDVGSYVGPMSQCGLMWDVYVWPKLFTQLIAPPPPSFVHLALFH